MHLNSRLLFKQYAAPYFKKEMRVLEIGPDGWPTSYQKIVADPSITWETLDIAGPENLTYRATDEYHFPIEDAQFDIVFSGQVVEHVRKVWVWVKEVARVCKPGGHVIMINPVSWPYHEAPVDCWRIYPEGMKALYEDAGIRMVMSKYESLSSSGWNQPLYLCNQVLKLITRKAPPMWSPVIDTISVGVKN